MEKSLKRREQFRAVWGVSPKSINQKRDMKTVLNVQNVKFSTDDLNSEDPEELAPKFENYNQMENEMFGLQIDEKNNIEEVEENEQQKIIDSEMFQQFIDANFPTSANNLSYAAHNFTGIDITTDGTSLDEIFVDPIQVSDNSSSVIESLHTDLGKKIPFNWGRAFSPQGFSYTSFWSTKFTSMKDIVQVLPI